MEDKLELDRQAIYVRGLESEVMRLYDALCYYGRHRPECSMPGIDSPPPRVCNCGFDEELDKNVWSAKTDVDYNRVIKV